MTAPADREFEVFERGAVRDLILEHFRAGLRNIVNPETGALFTTDEIFAATAEGTRYWNESTAIDDHEQGNQRNALFLNDQLRIERACTKWLEEYHAPQLDPDGRLKATPGSGTVLVTGISGGIIVGSTTVPDETAYWGRAANGTRVQVYQTTVMASESVELTMIAMDSGTSTNLKAGDVIEWSNSDPSMGPKATVTADWSGGTIVETDAEWVSRMAGNQRHKQGGGNEAQQRAWARSSSNAIEDCFIYSCAAGTGSTLFVPVQKRGGLLSANARVPNNTVLDAVTAYVVSPGSPENPAPPVGLVVPPQTQATNLKLRLSLQKGSSSGWEDSTPWPNVSDAAAVDVCSVSSAENLTTSVLLFAPGAGFLPGTTATGVTVTGANCPRLMWWDQATLSWKSLPGVTAAVQLASPSDDYYRITCTRPAAMVAGTRVSPSIASGLRPLIARSIRDYIDERGPGELFDLDTHYLGARCVRFPETAESNSPRVGAEVATRVVSDLAGAAADGVLVYASRTMPDYPANIADGPNMLTLGAVAVYPL